MTDASGQDDASVFKIKEEQKASPALEHIIIHKDY